MYTTVATRLYFQNKHGKLIAPCVKKEYDLEELYCGSFVDLETTKGTSLKGRVLQINEVIDFKDKRAEKHIYIEVLNA